MANKDYMIEKEKHDRGYADIKSFFDFAENQPVENIKLIHYFKRVGNRFVFCSCSEGTEENAAPLACGLQHNVFNRNGEER